VGTVITRRGRGGGGLEARRACGKQEICEVERVTSVARLVGSLGVPCLAESTLVPVLIATLGGLVTVGGAGVIEAEDGLWEDGFRAPSLDDATGVEGGLRVFDVPAATKRTLRWSIPRRWRVR
jgi:hypothetical protein